jgi:hypothetical protein
MDTASPCAGEPIGQVTQELAENVSLFNPAMSWSHILESEDLDP